MRAFHLVLSLLSLICSSVSAATGQSFHYESVDFPGARGTYVTDLDGSSLVGYYLDDEFAEHGFLRVGDTWQTLDFPMGFNAQAWGIDGGRVVGSYIDPEDGQTHAFVYEAGTWTRLDFPSPTASNTVARGVSGAKVVGSFIAPSTADPEVFVIRGFVLDGDRWSEFDYPGSLATLPTGIDGDRVVGSWLASFLSEPSGFYFDGASHQPLTPPSPFRSAFPNGIDGDRIVGAWDNPLQANSPHGFLYDGVTYSPVDYPGAQATSLLGIQGNRLVGYYIDPADFSARGFIGEMVPEPTTVGLLSLTFVAFGVLRCIGRDRRFNWTNMRCAAILGASAAFLLVAAHNAAAEFDTEWSNPSLGSWFIDSNWSNGMPSEIDDVTIQNGGTALVAAPGAIFGQLFVGDVGGSGTLVVNNGGTLSYSIYGKVTIGAGGPGAVSVSGAGSQLLANGIDLWGSHVGSLLVASGGLVGSSGSIIGSTMGSSAATVTGSGSVWNVTPTVVSATAIDVGYGPAQGMLTINGGGIVNNGGSARVGAYFGSTGTVTVSGAGSQWNNDGYLQVGSNSQNGVGSVSILDQGTVRAASLRVSQPGILEVNNGSSTASGLIVSGNAATATTEGTFGPLRIGSTHDGRMLVTSGATVRSGTGELGGAAGRTGTTTISGAGSAWTNSGDTLVGASGNGVVEIRSGASLSSFRAHVGFNSNSFGSMLVADPGSTWTAGGSMFIGNGGAGDVRVLNGAYASTAGNAYLGFSTFSQGIVNISGAGSTWNVANTLYIGGNGDGPCGPFASTLRIENGGLVNAGSTVLHNIGILELTDASTFNSPISSRGGLIRTFGPATHAGPISLDAGNLSITCSTLNTTATLSGVLSGPGGLTKSGFPGFTGSLRLTANSTYAGPTAINSGTLLVDGSIASATTVNNGGTLGGSGTVGPITVQSGGTLAPGNSVGLLSSGAASLRGGGNYDFELRTSSGGLPGTDWDSLAIAGTLDLSTLSTANRFNIRLQSLGAANIAGPLTDWNPGVDHTWPSIITTTDGLTNAFDSSLFNIDTTTFQSPVHGTFQLVQNGNNIDLSYNATAVVDGVLVTNFAEPLRDATPIGNNPNPVDPPNVAPVAPWYWAAQQFQSDGLPHQLVSIQARVGDGSIAPRPIVVAELRADSDGRLGDLIGTFTAPDVSGTPSELEFLPDQPTTLDPGTKYWFVLGSAIPGDGTFFWQYINTNFAAGPGVIGAFADSTDSGGTWNYHGGGENPYYLQVNVATNIPGDYNGDGVVGPEDYDEWRASFGSTTILTADGNGDQIVDAADYTIWRDQLGAIPLHGDAAALLFANTLPPAVPEPTGWVLLMLTAAGCCLGRGWAA